MSLTSPDREGTAVPTSSLSRPHTSPVMSSASNAHTVASVVGLAVAGALYLALPGALAAASVGVLSPSVAPYWAAALIVGGLLAFTGIARRYPRIEVLGLGLIASAMGLATSSIFDVRTLAMYPAGVVFLTHCVAAMARMAAVVNIERTRHRVAREASEAVHAP